MKGTIKSTDELSSLFKTARRHNSTNLVALQGNRVPSTEDPEQQSLPTDCPRERISDQQRQQRQQRRGHQGRLAFIAGKRLGSAPKRNRAKRLMREAARRLKVAQGGRDMVFIARERMTTASLDEVIRDMERLLGRMNGGNGR